LQLYKLSKESISNLTEQVNIASNLVEQGFLTAGDYLLMKIELQNELLNSSESLQNYKDDLTQLNSICGINDTNMVYLDSVALQLTELKNSLGFFKKYELDSLSLISQQYVFETKYLPRLKLFFNTGLNAVETNGIERKFGLSAGLSFSLPIFDGGQKNLTRQQSLISQKTVNNYCRYFSLNLELILSNTASKLKTIKRNLAGLDNQINEYKKVMEISVRDLNKGDISTIEFLNILKNFIDLKKSKIDKEIEYQMQINNFNYWNWQYE
jgi:outer membrane protein TolC